MSTVISETFTYPRPAVLHTPPLIRPDTFSPASPMRTITISEKSAFRLCASSTECKTEDAAQEVLARLRPDPRGFPVPLSNSPIISMLNDGSSKIQLDGVKGNDSELEKKDRNPIKVNSR